jgi:hypothetical protein
LSPMARIKREPFSLTASWARNKGVRSSRAWPFHDTKAEGMYKMSFHTNGCDVVSKA